MAIALAEKFLPVLDEIYKAESKTAILDGTNLDWTGVDTVKVAKRTMDGLGDYDRANGYPTGDVSLSWETMKVEQDRAAELDVDRMDNEESLGQAFGDIAGSFMREKAIPEIDAYRFAKYASAATLVKADLSSSTDGVALIDAAEEALNEAEVPDSGRVLFVSPKMYTALKKGITRIVSNESGISHEVEVYDGMPIIMVPQTRFNTAVTLNDGTSDFGFVPTAGGFKINFAIIHKDAVVNAVKLEMPKIFTADENQRKDAYLFQYREHHDAFVYDNKANGIYIHCASTANT